jgi:NTE family protein
VGLSEVGVLQWLEEHHIPVDVVAGTSMGCLVSSLYSTGRTPDQLTRVMNDRVFTSVFSFGDSYQSRSFRRREDSRELPNGITIGLKHGVSLRNAVLVDQGLNAFLDREFLRYDDQTDFNTLPIPLRCLATDLNEAKSVTFARGSVPDAVRASVSLPAVFPPFEMSGHEYVDGGVLVNLPTAVVRNDMHADVVIGVSLPLQPVAKGDLGSLLGVLARSFAVAIEAAERDQRRLADVVIIPDTSGFGATDYLKAQVGAIEVCRFRCGLECLSRASRQPGSRTRRAGAARPRHRARLLIARSRAAYVRAVGESAGRHHQDRGHARPGAGRWRVRRRLHRRL